MTWPGAAMLASVAVPALMLLACTVSAMRERMLSFLWVAPLPGLLTACIAPNAAPLVIDLPQARLTLALDMPGAILLGVCALLWAAAGWYATSYLRDVPNRGQFAGRWLLTLIGNMGVFVAADLLSFYLFFAIVSLAAYGLVVFDNTDKARRAGIIYLVLAILGEAFLVIGFVLLAEASKGDSLLIRDVVAALPGSPWRATTIIMVVAGFGIKAGLAPLHVWLPLAHPAAPMPASAVLSGAIVKAGVIGLIRFLPSDAGLAPDLSMSAWGAGVAAIGVFTAYYAVLVGLTHDNPKTILAYSTASQMGVVTAVIGMGLTWAQNDGGIAVAFYAAHHALAKGAMFLAVGVFAACGARWRLPVLAGTALVALGLAGLPLSGGALAKLAIKAPLGHGAFAVLTTLSAAGTAALMFHFLQRLQQSFAHEPDAAAAVGLILPWIGLVVSAFALPWLFFSGLIAPDPDMFSAYALWSAGWPIILGAAVWAAFATFGQSLKRIPEGDIVVFGEALAQRSGAWAETIERWDATMRRWPVAGLSLLSLAVILCMTMVAVR